MQRTALRFSRSALCCSIPALLALPAIAGTPAALDRVPTDSQVVVVVPQVGSFLNDINAMNAMLGDQGEPMVMMMTSMVRGMPGLNLEGSMATVLSMDHNQGGDPDMVILMPVSDFDAFTQGRDAVDGLVEFPLGDGQMMYTRDAGGGFAVFGEVAEQVKNYDAKGGNLVAHTAMLGKAGGRIADHNDLFVYVNIQQFDDLIDMGMQEMEAQGEMIEMMGGAEAAQSFDQMLSAMRSISDDAMSFSAGLNFDQELGVSFDFGLQFKDGSSSAGYLNNNGDAGKYFNNVPNMDYFMAAAYDMSGGGIQRFMGEYTQMIKKMDTSGMMSAMNMDKLMTQLKGGIQVVGASDNIMGGLLNNTVYYADVENPEAYIDAMRDMTASMGDSPELKEAGMAVDASVDAEPTEINGVKAYGFRMNMDMSQMNGAGAMGAANPAMIMQMMFGGSGPSGYIMQSGEHGLAATMSQSPAMIAKVAKAAKGEDTMGAVAALKQTASMLPDNRVMEMYIGADHLANTAGPMAMMFGLIPEFEPIASLPPLGMGLTADGGGMLFRTVVPMQTISKAMSVMEEMGAMQQDQDNQMDF
jgi:hypothetical protein